MKAKGISAAAFSRHFSSNEKSKYWILLEAETNLIQIYFLYRNFPIPNLTKRVLYQKKIILNFSPQD